MNALHRSLFTVGVTHAFRGGPCDELAFIVPAATRTTLQAMRALVRERGGVLHVLIAVSNTGQPLGECVGQRLVFGLAPRSPYFAQYTQPFAMAARQTPLFCNDTASHALDVLPRGVELLGLAPQITPRLEARPLELRVTTPAGAQIAHGRLQATDETWHFREGVVPGESRLTETAAGGQTATRAIYVEPSLAAAGCWGLLALTVSADHVANGGTFTLSLAAQSDVLRYYIVVRPTSDADFESIGVSDSGIREGGASTPVAFRRVLPPFDPGRLAPALLDASGTRRIVMFEAETPVARRERGPQGVELHRNGEVLIGNLPQPGAERNDAQFVVHLSKP